MMPDELIVTENQPPNTLLHETSPRIILEESKEIANALADLIEEKKLYTEIQNKKHVHVEGWTTLGALLKVFPILDWSKRLDREDEIIYESRVTAKTLQGEIIGVGEAVCSDKEVLRRRDGSTYKKWSDEYAVKSMSITRATSKALRIPLGWIMTLAGYSGTPFEDMPTATRQGKKVAAATPKPPAPKHTKTAKAPKNPPAPTKTVEAEAEVMPSYQELANTCKPLSMILDEMEELGTELNDTTIIEAGSMMVGRQDLTPGDLKVVRKALGAV